MPPAPETPAIVIGREVQRVRELRGWTAQQLADAVTEGGLKWDRFVVRNLEQGKRKSVGVEELLVLASVLGVHPVDLVVPAELADGDPYVIASVQVTAKQARDWIGGLGFLREPESRAEMRDALRFMPESRADWLEEHWRRYPPRAMLTRESERARQFNATSPPEFNQNLDEELRAPDTSAADHSFDSSDYYCALDPQEVKHGRPDQED